MKAMPHSAAFRKETVMAGREQRSLTTSRPAMRNVPWRYNDVFLLHRLLVTRHWRPATN